MYNMYSSCACIWNTRIYYIYYDIQYIYLHGIYIVVTFRHPQHQLADTPFVLRLAQNTNPVNVRRRPNILRRVTKFVTQSE